MGGKITIINSSSELLRIEVFSGAKDLMHHPPDNVINIEPKSEEKEIETTHKFNQRIRFLYRDWHCIIAVKNEAKLFFSENDAVHENWIPEVGKDESVIFKMESRNYICLRCLCKDDVDGDNGGDSSSLDGATLGAGLTSGAIAGVLAPTAVVDDDNGGNSSSIDGATLGAGLASGAVAGVLAPTAVVAGMD
jgi:hypothetical protein